MNKDISVEIDKLYDHCEEFIKTIIKCNNCGSSTTLHTDAYCASDRYYNEGWRIIDGNCFCPICTKIK
jgi:hypothetical protein